MPFHVSGQVREQVYETLRKQQHQQHPTYSEVMTSSSGSSNCGGQSATGPPVITPKPTIKGIRSKLTLPTTNPGSPPRAAARRHRDRSPPELPPPPQDVSDLYAKVDRAKKKKNRESSESGSNACSPAGSEQHAQVSPTKSLIQKFNTLGGQSGDQQQEGEQQRHQAHAPSPARRQANPKVNLVANPIAASGGGSQESLVRGQGQGEPMYATIGSKNRSQIASRFNSRPDNV